MSCGKARLNAPRQMRSVSRSRNPTIMPKHNASRYGAQVTGAVTWGILARVCRTFCPMPGCIVRLPGHLNDRRLLDSILTLHKHAAHMGLENVEAIAAVVGIDMIAYGHSDLSARLGVHLQLEHKTFKAAVRRIAEACNAHGKLARGSAETEAQIEEYWRLGCKVLNLPGTDVSTYLDGLRARAGRAHARLKSIGVPVP
jgi:hypothetical protein